MLVLQGQEARHASRKQVLRQLQQQLRTGSITVGQAAAVGGAAAAHAAAGTVVD